MEKKFFSYVSFNIHKIEKIALESNKGVYLCVLILWIGDGAEIKRCCWVFVCHFGEQRTGIDASVDIFSFFLAGEVRLEGVIIFVHEGNLTWLDLTFPDEKKIKFHKISYFSFLCWIR